MSTRIGPTVLSTSRSGGARTGEHTQVEVRWSLAEVVGTVVVRVDAVGHHVEVGEVIRDRSRDLIADVHALQQTPASWFAADLDEDTSWISRLSDSEAEDLITVVRAAPERELLDYRRCDFPFAGATLDTLGQAFTEVQRGRGISLLKGLPREGVSEEEFALMTWAIGLHFGVARPQDRETKYLNAVRNVGTVYRSATGRGYSSRSELDFHVDGSDIVGLTCYNTAMSGGESMVSSSEQAILLLETPGNTLAMHYRRPQPRVVRGVGSSTPFAWGRACLIEWAGQPVKCGVTVTGAGLLGVVVVVVVVPPLAQLEIVLEARVTAALRASSRPCTEAPVCAVIEVSARTVPTNVEFVPRVAELPTCQ